MPKGQGDMENNMPMHGNMNGMRRGGMMGGGMGSGMMMSMAHPIHLHGQQFQIISRKMEGMGKEEYASVNKGFIDSGWKDTVLVMPGEEIEIIKPFQDYTGLFLYHCHNLEHEDLGMMRQYAIG
jgi:bilirubin oxidase